MLASVGVRSRKQGLPNIGTACGAEDGFEYNHFQLWIRCLGAVLPTFFPTPRQDQYSCTFRGAGARVQSTTNPDSLTGYII